MNRPYRVTETEPGWWQVERKGLLWGWNRRPLMHHSRMEAEDSARRQMARHSHQPRSFPVEPEP